MKILHTSDWHIGHVLYDYDRHDEHIHIFKQIKEVIAEDRPDVLLVSGDIFNTSQPSAAAQKLLSETLIEFHETLPGMQIVLTAGNHDSPSRHEIFRTPWQRLGIHVVGGINRDDPDSHLIHIADKGVIAAIPYAYERNIPEGFIQDIIDRGRKIANGLPLIMMSHTTIEGCDFLGHEQLFNNNIGGIDMVTVDSFGKGYDYLALGHIHKPQTITLSGHIARYSGSPLPIGFDESYPHSLTMVNIEKSGDSPIIQERELTTLRPMLSIPADEWVGWNDAIEAFRQLPDDTDAYVRLNVLIETFLPPGAYQEALSIARNKKCRFCLINTKNKTRNNHKGHGMTLSEFRALSPLQVLRQFARDKKITFDDKWEDMFILAEKRATEIND